MKSDCADAISVVKLPKCFKTFLFVIRKLIQYGYIENFKKL